MGPKLEEFKKRLLLQPETEEQSSPAAEPETWEIGQQSSPAAELGTWEIVESAQSKFPPDAHPATDAMAAAVNKVFAQSSILRSRANEFASAVEQIDKLSKAVARAFGPLRAFYDQLAGVAGSFESLRLFQSQLKSLSKNFEPVSLLHDQVVQLTRSIELELGQVVQAFDPAKDLSDRVSQLSRSLDPANELQADFAELYTTFQNANQSHTPQLDGLEAQPSLH